MARNIKNEKGFLILKISRSEITKLNPMNLGICDRCNCSQKEGYYVSVLNWWMCSKCYHEWYSEAKKYDEDFYFEVMNYTNILRSIERFSK